MVDQRNIGVSMKVAKSSASDVRSRLAAMKAAKTASPNPAVDDGTRFKERLAGLGKAEEDKKEARKERKKMKKAEQKKAMDDHLSEVRRLQEMMGNAGTGVAGEEPKEGGEEKQEGKVGGEQAAAVEREEAEVKE